MGTVSNKDKENNIRLLKLSWKEIGAQSEMERHCQKGSGQKWGALSETGWGAGREGGTVKNAVRGGAVRNRGHV